MLDHHSERLSIMDDRFSDWQTIIWREWCRAKDEDYAFFLYDLVRTTSFGWKFVFAVAIVFALAGMLMGMLYIVALPTDDSTLLRGIFIWLTGLGGALFGIEGSRKYRAWYFWWKGQPSASKVEWALQQAKLLRDGAEDIWTEPLNRLQEQKEQESQPNELITALASNDWRTRFAARLTLAILGGEATPALKALADDRENPLWQVGLWLLTGIEQETTNRFAWRVRHTYCPYCLARFDACKVDMTWGIDFTFYGCRICHQSREFRVFPQGVVALLDSSESEEQIEQDGLLKINWLRHRGWFDFDWVEIAQASDEDVERFAVQIGNDTDPFRRARYSQMHCWIGPDCQLSENTLRILDRMFGGVEHTNLLPSQARIPQEKEDRSFELRPLTTSTNGDSEGEIALKRKRKLRKLTEQIKIDEQAGHNQEAG